MERVAGFAAELTRYPSIMSGWVGYLALPPGEAEWKVSSFMSTLMSLPEAGTPAARRG